MGYDFNGLNSKINQVIKKLRSYTLLQVPKRNPWLLGKVNDLYGLQDVVVALLEQPEVTEEQNALFIKLMTMEINDIKTFLNEDKHRTLRVNNHKKKDGILILLNELLGMLSRYQPATYPLGGIRNLAKPLNTPPPEEPANLHASQLIKLSLLGNMPKKNVSMIQHASQDAINNEPNLGVYIPL